MVLEEPASPPPPPVSILSRYHTVASGGDGTEKGFLGRLFFGSYFLFLKPTVVVSTGISRHALFFVPLVIPFIYFPPY